MSEFVTPWSVFRAHHLVENWRTKAVRRSFWASSKSGASHLDEGVTLQIRSKFSALRPRSVIGGAVASAVLLVSMGFGTAAGASTIQSASPSAFCSTIITYHPTTIPNPKSLTAYKAWAKSLIPFYEKLASEAPNASTKSLLNAVVAVLKYYASSTSLPKLNGYILKYHSKWAAGSKALATAIISCAKSLE
jgi:hypothetical protein